MTSATYKIIKIVMITLIDGQQYIIEPQTPHAIIEVKDGEIYAFDANGVKHNTIDGGEWLMFNIESGNIEEVNNSTLK